jgi:hypothetical protein
MGSSCVNGLNQPGQLVRAKRLFQAGRCSMPMKFGHPRCVLSVYERDHWRRCLRVAQRFEDSKAVDTGTNVNNRDINIVQSKAEDVEYLSSAASRYNTASRFPRGFPVCFHHGVLAFL